MAVHDLSPHPWRLADAEAAGDLFAPLAAEPKEVLAFAYLGDGQRVLAVSRNPGGVGDAHRLSIRAVVAQALEVGASGVVMAHNHPSGDPTPSLADREATHLLVRALDPLGVRLIDHLVVARRGITSFRGLGLL